MLAISQPALSTRIKRLEDELGFALFHRDRSGVTVSDSGRKFRPHATQLLRQVDATRRAAHDVKRGVSDQLRIGYTPVSFFSFVPDIIREFSKRNPDISMSFRECLSDDVEEALAQEDIDVGFLHPPLRRGDLNCTPLPSERYMLAIPEDNPLAKKPEIAFADLANESFVLTSRYTGPVLFDKIKSIANRNGFEPKVAQEVTTSIAVLGLVATGQGIGLVIESMRYVQRPGLVYRPISGETPMLPFAVATRKLDAAIGAKKLAEIAGKFPFGTIA